MTLAAAASVLVLAASPLASAQEVAQQTISADNVDLPAANPAADSTADAPLPAQSEQLPEPNVEVVSASSSHENAAMGGVVSAGDESISAVPHRFQYGVRLTIRGVYDDNINLGNTDHTEDYYFAIEPALTLGFGDIVGRTENYIRLDYAPSIFLFADHSENDAVQHLIHLEGQHRFGRLTLTLSQEVQILDGANLDSTGVGTSTGPTSNFDVSGRTRLNVYATRLGASYDLSGKTFLTSSLQYNGSQYENGLISSNDVSANLFLNYTYSPKFVIGLGGTGGYNWVDSPSQDQTFEQANVRATYQATGKISLNGSAGVEFRQFDGANSRGEYISPVFEIGATYQPFDGTNISLSANRRTLNSAVFAGQDYAVTNFTVGVRQRMLQRVYLGLTAGYENSDYFSTVDGVSSTRSDNYFFVEPAVDVQVTRWLTVGAYYLHRENDSSFNSFSFDDNQVGVRASLTF